MIKSKLVRTDSSVLKAFFYTAYRDFHEQRHLQCLMQKKLYSKHVGITVDACLEYFHTSSYYEV